MVGFTMVGNLLAIYGAYVVAIGIAHKFEISILEAFKKSVTLPLTPFKRLKPLTPLQKEIREEERIIKELKRQKADMERLAALKRERDALFEEVGDKHAERVEVKCNNIWIDLPDVPQKAVRDCPSCGVEAMGHYPGFPEYDWFCHNCLSKYKNERDEMK